MKVRLLPIAVLAFILIQAESAFSQPARSNPLEPDKGSSAIYIGPVAGYNRSIHSVNLASFAEDPLCPFFTNGTSNGYYFGLSLEVPFAAVNSRHSIITRVLYNSLPASFSQTGDTYPSLVESVSSNNDTTYTIVNSSTEHTIDLKYNLLTVEVMYKFNALGNLGITVGPTIDFPITKTFDQRFSLIEPDNVQFKKEEPTNLKYINNDRTIIVNEGDIKDASSIRFAVKIGLQYEFIMGGRYYIVPSVYYNMGLTNVTSAEDWKVSAFQAGVDVRFAI